MPLILPCNHPSELCNSLFIGVLFHSLKRKRHNRIFSLIRHIVLTGIGNIQPFKQIGIVFLRFLKEPLDHAQVQCLAEPSGAGEQIHLTDAAGQLAKELCLVGIVVVIIDQRLEVFDPDREFFFSVHLCHLFSGL